MNHCHHVKEYNSEKYWGDVIKFLHKGNLLDNKQAAVQLINQARKFLLFEGALWRRNGDKPLLQVVLNPKICSRILQNAHDGTL